MDAPFGSWATQALIVGLSAVAFIAPWVIKGAMGGGAFTAYVSQVLVPVLEPDIVTILDNLSTHKHAVAAKAMCEAGYWFFFLPPYRPDLNPTEMAFSELKAHLRRIGVRTHTEMFNSLTKIHELLTPNKCWKYFKAKGYPDRVSSPLTSI